jgi:PPOX class probable F420-dependent enzyme
LNEQTREGRVVIPRQREDNPISSRASPRPVVSAAVATLTEQQAQLFLDPNYGVVTTLRRDGSPQMTVVWLDWDGEHVVFNTAEGRVKPRNIRRNPAVGVFVMNPEDPYRWIAVTGTAEMTREGAAEHIDKLAKKYFGRDSYGLQPGEQRIIVRVRPERVTAYGVD